MNAGIEPKPDDPKNQTPPKPEPGLSRHSPADAAKRRRICHPVVPRTPEKRRPPPAQPKGYRPINPCRREPKCFAGQAAVHWIPFQMRAQISVC